MIPIELPSEILQLPETDRPTIVLVTGNGLRHRRFALRMQQAFAAQVVGWFELDEKQALRASEGSSPSQVSRDSGAKRRTRPVEQGHPLKRSVRRLRALAKRDPLADYYRSLVVAEQTIFAEEVAELAGHAVVAPTSVHPADVNNADFLATLQKFDPYFFLTLGGPLYKRPLAWFIDAVLHLYKFLRSALVLKPESPTSAP